MAEAVERLQQGKLVAFPTETVYGLGADARNADAVASIFLAKGRPSTNPLIVHVADGEAARRLAKEWTAIAEKLAAAYWPGPLTLVLASNGAIPPIVTAGGDTVGLRVPNHPVALELLRLCCVPVAAPSANRSEEVSPTTAQHVADSLEAYVTDLLILDGGACTVGIESTVVDATGDVARVLRPGMVVIPEAALATSCVSDEAVGAIRSPGQMARHYAPRAPVLLVSVAEYDTEATDQDGMILPDLFYKANAGFAPPPANVRLLPSDPAGYAAGLYAALRSLDDVGVRRIVVLLPPGGKGWAAIHDRLRRAATPKIDVE